MSVKPVLRCRRGEADSQGARVGIRRQIRAFRAGDMKETGRRGRHRVGGRLAKSVRGGGCSADLTGSSWRSELTLCPIPPTSPPPPESELCKGFAEGGATCVSQNQTGN